MQARVKFDLALSEHIAHFRAETNKPIICAGDLNINPRRVDWHEKAFASMSRLMATSGITHHPGCSPSELEGYEHILRKSNLTNAWEYLYPSSSQGMTWHPPTDPQGLLGWGQRLDHFLVTPEFLSNSEKYRLGSIMNLRGEGSSDHNGLLLELLDSSDLPVASLLRED